jgi:hypothetical protein
MYEPEVRDIKELIERSSLGTPEAKAIRATVSDEEVAKVLDLAAKLRRTMPHPYLSTYCYHENHGDCRLTCKTCAAPCICDCHKKGEMGVKSE